MKNAYDILEVTEHMSDSDIKLAYLQKVKQYPPDRDSQKFQELHSAYEAIKDRKSRTKYALFYYPEADFNSLLDHAFAHSPSSLNADAFIKLLRASVDEHTLLNSTAQMAKTL